MKLRILKLHPNAQVPVYATEGAACFDLHAAEVNGMQHVGDVCYPGHPVVVNTGLAFEVPPGYMLRIASRSGLAFKHGITAFPGVIDSDYRGAVNVMLTCDHLDDDTPPIKINPGDRVAQGYLVAVPRVEFEVAEQLTITERGANGFGSTDQGDGSETDPLYKQALLLVTYTRKTSISYVQAHMGIGYNRAARLLETMEKKGILSPMDSSGQRKIIWQGDAA